MAARPELAGEASAPAGLFSTKACKTNRRCPAFSATHLPASWSCVRSRRSSIARARTDNLATARGCVFRGGETLSSRSALRAAKGGRVWREETRGRVAVRARVAMKVVPHVAAFFRDDVSQICSRSSPVLPREESNSLPSTKSASHPRSARRCADDSPNTEGWSPRRV